MPFQSPGELGAKRHVMSLCLALSPTRSQVTVRLKQSGHHCGAAGHCSEAPTHGEVLA